MIEWGPMLPSASWLGYRSLTPEIAGSNPLGSTLKNLAKQIRRIQFDRVYWFKRRRDFWISITIVVWTMVVVATLLTILHFLRLP